MQHLQDLVQDLASLAKILARFAYFLQDSFYWVWYRIILAQSKLSCKKCASFASILLQDLALNLAYSYLALILQENYLER